MLDVSVIFEIKIMKTKNDKNFQKKSKKLNRA